MKLLLQTAEFNVVCVDSQSVLCPQISSSLVVVIHYELMISLSSWWQDQIRLFVEDVHCVTWYIRGQHRLHRGWRKSTFLSAANHSLTSFAMGRSAV